jgi:hypothetical protein
MAKVSKILATAVMVCLGIVSGCAEPLEGKAARGFMDAYYVDADLKRAGELSDGLALEKVTAGMGLRDGLSIDVAAHHPRIHYRLENSHVGSDQAEFVYDVEFHPEKAQVFHKKVRLTLRRRAGDRWKVTQFSDYDPL